MSTHRAGVLLWIALAAGGGCGKSGAATSSASASGSASAGAFDLGSFCESVCTKSADCSVSNAEELAKTGDELSKKTLEEARAGREALKKECTDSCVQTSSQREEDLAVARRAEACLKEDRCTAYVDCLRNAAVTSPQ